MESIFTLIDLLIPYIVHYVAFTIYKILYSDLFQPKFLSSTSIVLLSAIALASVFSVGVEYF